VAGSEFPEAVKVDADSWRCNNGVPAVVCSFSCCTNDSNTLSLLVYSHFTFELSLLYNLTSDREILIHSSKQKVNHQNIKLNGNYNFNVNAEWKLTSDGESFIKTKSAN